MKNTWKVYAEKTKIELEIFINKIGGNSMNVLVINCGSSSLKYQLINSDSEEVLAKGLCERIGISGSAITVRNWKINR